MRNFTISLFLLIGGSLYAQCTQPIWADEFNDNTLDVSKWAFETGNGCPGLCGWGNNELEYYTTNSKNASIKNGILTIEAVKENLNGSSFTSSKLRTLGKASWKYGRMEARMRMPLGRGLWPAFWMLSVNNDWPMTGEIDIMEYRGDQPRQTNSTLHYGSKWPQNQYDGSSWMVNPNLSEGFHVYSVEWTESEIRFYFDNTLINMETKNPNSLNPVSNGNPWPWTSEFYIILNLAVGGNYTGNPSVSQVELTKPTFEIDYVRVYELPCVATGLDNEPDAEKSFHIYPQPASDLIHIASPCDMDQIRVMVKDIQGISLKETTLKNGEGLSLLGLTNGIYFLEIGDNDKHIVRKVVKH